MNAIDMGIMWGERETHQFNSNRLACRLLDSLVDYTKASAAQLLQDLVSLKGSHGWCLVMNDNNVGAGGRQPRWRRTAVAVGQEYLRADRNRDQVRAEIETW